MENKMRIIALIMFSLVLSACASNGSKKTSASQVSGNVSTGTGTLLIKQVVFGKDAVVRQAVKNECHLLTKLSGFVKSYADDQYANIIENATKSSTAGDLLSIEIVSLHGSGGGAWSGAKSVTIKGKLIKKGKLVADFTARRVSGGGMFAAYKGTCAILGRCVKTLGKDIAGWLKNPTKAAVLGDL